MRVGYTCARLAAGFEVGITAACRYVTEAVELLAVLAPGLHRCGADRFGEGVSDPGWRAFAERPYRRGSAVLLW
ncbi:hypothetical protein [Streptomyces somaliensis]|uniref:hypothetical protein n=1 Tax=Streptomyces somaliensis TaxID=78355 RepID=UPI00355857C0